MTTAPTVTEPYTRDKVIDDLMWWNAKAKAMHPSPDYEAAHAAINALLGKLARAER